MAKKNLTVESLKEKNKKYDEYVTYEVNEEWDIEIKKEWSTVDIASLAGEFASTLRNSIGVVEGFQEVSSSYLFILLLKYFTKFGEDIPDDLEGQIDLMNEMINDGVFVDIINCFPQDQLEKVNNQLELMAKYLNEQADKLDEEASEIDLENEEVKNLLQ